MAVWLFTAYPQPLPYFPILFLSQVRRQSCCWYHHSHLVLTVFFAPDFGTFRELFLTLFLVMCVRFYQCGSTDCLEQWSIQAVQLSSRSLGSSVKVRGGPAGRPGCRGRAWGAPSPAASEAACVSWCALCAANRVEINMYFVWNTDSHNFLKIRLFIFVSI